VLQAGVASQYTALNCWWRSAADTLSLTRTVQSNVVHDNFLPRHCPSMYVTEGLKDRAAYTHMKATAATVWLNGLLTTVHTV
jgi:hypothetical protein